MEIKKGISVSPGVVISTAVVLDAEDLLIPKRFVAAEQVAQELGRVETALADSAAELKKLRESAQDKLGPDVAKIFDFHLAVLKDKSILKQVSDETKKNHTTAEYA